MLFLAMVSVSSDLVLFDFTAYPFFIIYNICKKYFGYRDNDKCHHRNGVYVYFLRNSINFIEKTVSLECRDDASVVMPPNIKSFKRIEFL